MLGFLLGTACVLGFCATLRSARRCGYDGHGGFDGRWVGRHGGWPFGGMHGGFRGFDGPFGPRGWAGPQGRHGFGGGGWRGSLRQLFARLETTPAQEKALVDAFEKVRDAVRDARSSVSRSRDDLARALRDEQIDATRLGEAFARWDGSATAVREAASNALFKAHEVLTERQRRDLADWLSSASGAHAPEGPFGVDG